MEKEFYKISPKGERRIKFQLNASLNEYSEKIRKEKAMKELEKEKSQQEKRENELFSIPKNIRQIGQVEIGRKIYIEDYALSYIKYLGKEGMEDYKIAVLLGEYKVQEESGCIFIRGVIEIEGINLEEDCFTKEVWEKLYHQIEENFKEEHIVGWMVTKAGLELESTEKLVKIHIDNFAGQDKTLLLYDSLDREEAFFLFRDNELQRENGYYIYYEKNQQMQEYMIKKKGNIQTEKIEENALKQMRKKMETMEIRKGSDRKVKKRLRKAAVLGAILGGVVLWQNKDQVNKWCKKIWTSIGEEKMVIEEMESGLDTRKMEVESVGNMSAKEENDGIRQIHVKKDIEKETEVEQIKEEDQGQYYIIQPGDTMVSICMSQFQSVEQMEKILEINQIQDKDRIVAGQKIKLWE